MVNDHWFDDLSKTAVQAASRREISRSLAAVVSALLLGGLVDSTAAKRKKGKGSGNGKGKGSGNDKRPKKPKKPRKPEPPAPPPPPPSAPSPPSPPPPDICDTTWPGRGTRTTEVVPGALREISVSGPGGSRAFCIREGRSRTTRAKSPTVVREREMPRWQVLPGGSRVLRRHSRSSSVEAAATGSASTRCGDQNCGGCISNVKRRPAALTGMRMRRGSRWPGNFALLTVHGHQPKPDTAARAATSAGRESAPHVTKSASTVIASAGLPARSGTTRAADAISPTFGSAAIPPAPPALSPRLRCPGLSAQRGPDLGMHWENLVAMTLPDPGLPGIGSQGSGNRHGV